MKHTLTLLLLALWVSGCASTYKPSQNVLRMSNEMSKEQARQVLSATLVSQEPTLGICQGNGVINVAGVSDSDMWEVDKKNPDIKVSDQGFSLNALQRAASTSAKLGYIPSIEYTTVTTKINLVPFHQTIEFDNVNGMKVFYTANYQTFCNQPQNHAEIRISLDTGMGNFIWLVVENSEVENFIAAMMVLIPGIEVVTS